MAEVAGARDFAGSGDAYDRFMGRFSQLLAPQFADFCGVQGGQRLLDVGCGPGAFTAVAADVLGPAAVVAVDPSPSFVEACRARHPEVDVRQGAGEDLPVEDEAFDRAVSQLVLHFVTDPPRVVAEMTRAVRPGGVVGGCVWHGTEDTGLLHVVAAAREAVEPPSAEPEVRPFGGEGELAALFTGAGLVDVVDTALPVTVRYRDFAELWDSLLEGVGPAGAYVVSLAPERRETYRDALFGLVGRPSGDFTLTMTALAVRGTRAS